MIKISNMKLVGDFKIEFLFSDGVNGTIDIEPLIKQGGVFASLRESKIFKSVRVNRFGRSIEWDGEVDLCADSLYKHIQGQHDLFSVA